ncbi:MAG: hypothetical protein HC774_07360, partial [Sphingomonadales bacterium]|nr:hypothetical protein [Sphingomonadales bacterium]
RTVKMAGFRPGKVPFKVVAQQYGPQVRQEVLGDTLQKTFGDAVREQKLQVAGYPKFDAAPPAEGESDGDQRNAMLLDEPHLNAGWADDLLHLACRGEYCRSTSNDSGVHAQQQQRDSDAAPT